MITVVNGKIPTSNSSQQLQESNQMAVVFVILVRMLYHCATTDSPEQRTSNKVHLINVSVFFILLAQFNGFRFSVMVQQQPPNGIIESYNGYKTRLKHLVFFRVTSNYQKTKICATTTFVIIKLHKCVMNKNVTCFQMGCVMFDEIVYLENIQ